MKHIDATDHWRWGLRWFIIPWQYRWKYCREDGNQKYIWMEREWKKWRQKES